MLTICNPDGSTEGADPRRLDRKLLEAAGHVGGPPLKAIRAKCLDCSCYQPSEVAKCTATGCALWPYRMGRDPFAKPRGRPFPATAAPPEFPPQIATVSDGKTPSGGEVAP